jgi:hypothetical protein
MRHEKFFENRSMLVVVDMVAAKRREVTSPITDQQTENDSLDVVHF